MNCKVGLICFLVVVLLIFYMSTSHTWDSYFYRKFKFCNSSLQSRINSGVTVCLGTKAVSTRRVNSFPKPCGNVKGKWTVAGETWKDITTLGTFIIGLTSWIGHFRSTYTGFELTYC